MEEKVLPEFLIKELKQQYGEEIYQKVLKGYLQNRVVSLRVNTLKSTVEKVCAELTQNQIEFEPITWNSTAFVIKNATEEELKKLAIYEKGEIYLQSLSSMLPPVIMMPQEGIDILDMTAAPGGKTTQIAAMTNNKAHITACEMNHIRAERMKFNLDKQGASSVVVLEEDSRRLSDYFAFDQILLDAPCSGIGTIRLDSSQTYKSISEKLIQKCTTSQLTLLKKALKILKPGHEMIYSTCSILAKENEEILEKALKETNAEIVPIDVEGLKDVPQLPTKIGGTLCVCPSKYYDGFFVAKIRKG